MKQEVKQNFRRHTLFLLLFIGYFSLMVTNKEM